MEQNKSFTLSITVSQLASLIVLTFFLVILLRTKLVKIGESSYELIENSSGSTVAERFSVFAVLVVHSLGNQKQHDVLYMGS